LLFVFRIPSKHCQANWSDYGNQVAKQSQVLGDEKGFCWAYATVGWWVRVFGEGGVLSQGINFQNVARLLKNILLPHTLRLAMHLFPAKAGSDNLFLCELS